MTEEKKAPIEQDKCIMMGIKIGDKSFFNTFLSPF